MVTRGIVEQVIDPYHIRVRLPLYDGAPFLTTSVPTSDLSVATVCTLPNTNPNIQVGDIVFVVPLPISPEIVISFEQCNSEHL